MSLLSLMSLFMKEPCPCGFLTQKLHAVTNIRHSHNVRVLLDSLLVKTRKSDRLTNHFMFLNVFDYF